MDSECSRNWDASSYSSCGLCGHVHVGVGPGESLSFPHSVHNGSRDFPRGLEGLLGRWGFAVAHHGGKDTGSGGPKEFVLVVLFIVFIFIKHLKIFFNFYLSYFIFYLIKFIYLFIASFLYFLLLFLFYFVVFFFCFCFC